MASEFFSLAAEAVSDADEAAVIENAKGRFAATEYATAAARRGGAR